MPRALVVDDAPDIRLLVREILERSGFDVSEADGGGNALRALAEDELPDVVVLDVQMPNMDGWEVLTTLRARRETADVKVVLCTVKAGPADALRAWELGCDGFVAKPFEITALAEEVLSVSAREEPDRTAVREARRTAVRATLGER